VLARVLLAQGRPGQALALLARLYAAAAAQDRVGSLIEAGALRALALAATGEEAEAVNALAEALTLACPHGYVRVFADEGEPMAALLARLIAAQRAGHAARIPLAGSISISDTDSDVPDRAALPMSRSTARRCSGVAAGRVTGIASIGGDDQIIADEGPAMAALLGRLVAA